MLLILSNSYPEYMTYESRGKDLNNNVQINCPKHGMQQTYDLIIKDKFAAVGCYKCFEELPAIELTNKHYK